jgi:hypothetical protein
VGILVNLIQLRPARRASEVYFHYVTARRASAISVYHVRRTVATTLLTILKTNAASALWFFFFLQPAKATRTTSVVAGLKQVNSQRQVRSCMNDICKNVKKKISRP